MVRANIRNRDNIYLGLIDEIDAGFRIVWNWNMENYPEYDRSGSVRIFDSFEEACQGVMTVVRDAEITETIFYKGSLKT